MHFSLKTLIIGFLVVDAVALVLSFASHGSVYRELETLRMIPRQEQLTELYLNDSATLPVSVIKGQIVPFSFTIHNLEGKREAYGYQVYAILASSTRISIASSTIDLPDAASTTIMTSFQFSTSTAAVKPVTIYITIPAFDETLHFVLPSRE